jgi:phosphatidylserine/phosphatidylglycerophosphate/cardiolipin synthase-like enzyme
VVGALAAAARRGVAVQILMSGTPTVGKKAYLEQAGVQFHDDKALLIHAKVLIVDQQRALLGSINFTPPSLDRNRELSVVITDPKLIQQLVHIFHSDWHSA